MDNPHRPFHDDDNTQHDDDSTNMAALAIAASSPTQANNALTNPTSRDAQVAKPRYRAAPAKTFQCRGYGDCHMVFSRSEHLARHVRKHTGERPFTCHCSKQFSRLDNLRQHAQTVHSDKQEQNEAMMRDLTALHTSMTSVTKGAASRGKRAGTSHGAQTPVQQLPHALTHPSALASSAALVGSSTAVKVEELQMHRTLSHTNYAGPLPHLPGTHWTTALAATSNSRRASPSASSSSSISSSFEEYLYQHQQHHRAHLPPTPPITPPTAIPFVTTPSPFEPHHHYHNNNNNSSSSPSSSSSSSIHPPPHHPQQVPASPFSPPPLSSLSDGRHPLAQQAAAQAAGLPLQADSTLYAQCSRPSLPLSPNPSPHPASSLTYFPYPPSQDPTADRAPPLDPEQLPQHISPTGILSAGPEDFPAWGLSQNYPFTPLDTAGSTSASLPNWAAEEHTHMAQHHHHASENTSRTSHHHHPTTERGSGATTARFPSTHPRPRTPRGMHPGSGASGRTTTGPVTTVEMNTAGTGIGGGAAAAAGTTMGRAASTMTRAPSAGRAGVQHQGHHPPRAPPTPTGASPALSLDGSPSWNSAMTPSLAQQLFFHYQGAHDQPPPLDGSHPSQGQQHQQGQQQQGQGQGQEYYHQHPLLQQQQADLRSMHTHQHQQREEYLQQHYAALHRQQQQAEGGEAHPHQAQAYYLSGGAPGLPPHPGSGYAPDGEAHQVHPLTPTTTSLQTPVSVYSSPPGLIKFESPSLHGRQLQLLPE